MLQRVYEQRTQYNNQAVLVNKWLWSTGKLIYYHMFAKVYGFCGSFAEVVMANSTWTKGHIDQLWKTEADIVYPPCDTESLNELSLENRKPMIISVAQFRYGYIYIGYYTEVKYIRGSRLTYIFMYIGQKKITHYN